MSNRIPKLFNPDEYLAEDPEYIRPPSPVKEKPCIHVSATARLTTPSVSDAWWGCCHNPNCYEIMFQKCQSSCSSLQAHPVFSIDGPHVTTTWKNSHILEEQNLPELGDQGSSTAPGQSNKRGNEDNKNDVQPKKPKLNN